MTENPLKDENPGHSLRPRTKRASRDCRLQQITDSLSERGRRRSMVANQHFDKLTEKGPASCQNTQAMIHNARILNSLALGRRERPTTILQRKFALARK